MGHPLFPGNEISRIGQEIYKRNIRPLVETEENIGKVISIDIETGDYEIGDDFVEPALRFLLRRPDAAIYTTPIGHDDTIYIGGGSITSMMPFPELIPLDKD